MEFRKAQSGIINLFVPPNKRNKNAQRYKSLIDAKVLKKQSNYREHNIELAFFICQNFNERSDDSNV